MSRPPLPPFNEEAAREKVRLAEDGWNGRDPAKVALAYTPDSKWRNRAEFPQGREEIEEFLTRKWKKELDYRLIKELWAYRGNRIAVRCVDEYRDDSGHWFRANGNENWQFDQNGLMEERSPPSTKSQFARTNGCSAGRSVVVLMTIRGFVTSDYDCSDGIRLWLGDFDSMRADSRQSTYARPLHYLLSRSLGCGSIPWFDAENRSAPAL